MKAKIQIIIVLLFTAIGSVYAQNPIPKGQTQLNFGLGLNSYNIPIYFGLDQGVGNNISLGGELSLQGQRHADHLHTIVGIFGNGNYHFNDVLDIPRNWDFYAGLNLGFYLYSNRYENRAYFGRSSGIGLGGQLGGRYYFNNKAGINLEFNAGNYFAGGKFGLSFRI
ncbi:hypothetical protein LAG90_12710 [Marinilongibacter aquaticus]|uniref:hypothetical protein n=1 Tax=Marinilongibacter aquaticus TaxID=2975157 RepID=UPI0021BD18C2|nr:hypothetical protein [Marinilongibacter aquaticus]UBM57676.1 hypothetical protein LAG90_12710 [Marinilongibacter aquaticus]